MRTLLVLIFCGVAGRVSAGPIEEVAASRVANIARIDLRMQHTPEASDYRIGMLALSIAQGLAPDNAELTRDIMQAAYNAGDAEEAIAQNRRLIVLDPSDTVAQLRLISWNIGRLQTAEERIAAYDRYLGPKGERLDPAVRSRLATDAAMLSRELGDPRGFVERLSQATALDVTNKEAASLALAYFSERTEDPVGRMDLLFNLLAADPIDPNVHRWIMLELARNGAYRGARRYHAYATALMHAGLQDPPQAMETERLALAWHANGARATFDLLNGKLEQKRYQSETFVEAVESGKVDEFPESLRLPDEVRLEPMEELFLLFSASALGEDEAVEAALDRFEMSVREDLEELQSPERGLEPAVAARAAFVRIYELFRLRAMLGIDPEGAEKISAELAQLAARNEAITRDLEAWSAMRRGDFGAAIAYFEEAPERETASRVGLALAYQATERYEESGAVLDQLASDHALDAFGGWAVAKRRALVDEGKLGAKGLSQTAYTLEAYAAQTPRWLEEMLFDPTSFMQLRLEQVDDATLRITLRNRSPVALGLGMSRPINSRIMLSPRAEARFEELVGSAQPEIVDLGRRLRLGARESISVDVPIDVGYTGWLLGTMRSKTLRTRWRAIQGMMIGERGYFVPGPLCLSTEAGSRTLPLLEETTIPIEELASRIADAPPEDLPDVFLAVRALLIAGDEPGLDSAQRELLAGACADRYVTLDPAGRLLLLASVPHRGQAPEMGEVDALALKDVEPSVLAFALLTRATDPEDEAFARALELGDERVSELADLLSERLREGTPCFALATPDPASIAGFFRGSGELEDLQRDKFERALEP